LPNHTLYTEQQLLQQIAEGDEKAFTELFYRYKSPLFDYALKITKTVVAAEELVQDSFLKLWLYRASLAETEYAAGYLHRMIRNASVDWLRKLALDRSMQKAVAVTFEHFAETTAEDVQLSETRRLIAEAVDRLSPQQKEVFRLSRYEGLSYEEIGGRLGLSGNTVRNHLVKALKTIREYLAAEYGAAVVLVILHFLERH
jgi:RNA polymerase sigma-70 factor (family 1)